MKLRLRVIQPPVEPGAWHIGVYKAGANGVSIIGDSNCPMPAVLEYQEDTSLFWLPVDIDVPHFDGVVWEKWNAK